MKNVCLIISLIFFITSSILAQEIENNEFTVVAPSGLSLRNNPNLSSKKLEIIPFGTLITIMNVSQIFNTDEMKTIDSRPGNWVKTKFNGKEGYVFSGYLKKGPLYLPSTIINKDFRLIQAGQKCDAVNYDPNLNWYGLSFDNENKKTNLIPVNISFDYTSESTKEELEYSYYPIGEFVNVKTNKKENFSICIGTKEPLDLNNIDFEKGWFKDENYKTGYYSFGKLVYPYQRIEIAKVNNRPYYLVGHEVIKPTNHKYPSRNYQLYLSTNTYGIEFTRKDTVELIQELREHPYNSYSLVSGGGIRLIWQGDINSDGFPDLLFFSPNVSDSCGGSTNFYLMISEKQGDHFILKKAAQEYIGSCHGC